MAKIKISTPGVKKSLRNYNYLEALSEYVWNGFDAEASTVEVNFIENALHSIDLIEVVDNGYGIQKRKTIG